MDFVKVLPFAAMLYPGGSIIAPFVEGFEYAALHVQVHAVAVRRKIWTIAATKQGAYY